jgi:hypothetical protein
MAFASTYPAAKAALIALWTAAVQVPVINGPTVGVGYDGVVTVGYQDENNPIVLDGVMLREASGLNIPEREQYTIYCSVGVNYGSIGIAAGEVAVFGLFAALGAALEANFTLNAPSVMSAGVDRYQLFSSQGNDGLTLILKFGVAIDAYTTV